MNTKLALATAAALFFGATTAPAVAQGFKEDMVAKRIEAADKDKDGFVSREEAKALPRLAKQFDQIDTNKDGKLSKEELVAFREKNKK